MAHDHDHGHDRDHNHGHAGHHHHHHDGPGAGGSNAAFAIGSAVNLLFVIVQVATGLLAHSTALLADAAHNMGDVLGLLLAWGAAVLARRSPSARRTYGWGRSTVLAALANAAIVLLSCGAIVLEAVQRLLEPAPVAGLIVMAVAAAGIVVNGGTALLFARGRHGDLNLRGAFVHMLSDALVSAGVVVAAGLIFLTGMTWIDPVASLVIVAIVVAGTWRLGRDSVDLALDAVPGAIDPAQVEACLRAIPGVQEVHDLHIWGLSTTAAAMTAHLVQSGGSVVDTIIHDACAAVRPLGIAHATVQVETADFARTCELRPSSVV